MMYTLMAQQLSSTSHLGLGPRRLDTACGTGGDYAIDVAHGLGVAVLTHVKHSFRLLLSKMTVLRIYIVIILATRARNHFSICKGWYIACRPLGAHRALIIVLHHLLVKL
jgi:hypothetical protein